MGRRHGRQSRRFRIERPVRSVAPRPTIIIVSDDTKTAVAYFGALAIEMRSKVTIKVVRAPRGGATAQAITSIAADEFRGLVRGGGRSTNDGVFALIDREHLPHTQRAADVAAQGTAQKRGFRVLRSQSCFEVWTLLHLIDTGELFKDCSAVVTRIKMEWKKALGSGFGTKAQAEYAKLMPLRNDAAKRSRQHRNDPTWTEIYEIIDAIDAIP